MNAESLSIHVCLWGFKKKISVCSFPYVCCIYILLDVYSLIHFLDTKQFWFSYMDITL